jgi:hypothetical protein
MLLCRRCCRSGGAAVSDGAAGQAVLLLGQAAPAMRTVASLQLVVAPAEVAKGVLPRYTHMVLHYGQRTIRLDGMIPSVSFAAVRLVGGGLIPRLPCIVV